jgi:hypothetical protein
MPLRDVNQATVDLVRKHESIRNSDVTMWHGPPTCLDMAQKPSSLYQGALKAQRSMEIIWSRCFDIKLKSGLRKITLGRHL